MAGKTFYMEYYENHEHALLERIFYVQCREPSSMYFMQHLLLCGFGMNKIIVSIPYLCYF